MPSVKVASFPLLYALALAAGLLFDTKASLESKEVWLGMHREIPVTAAAFAGITAAALLWKCMHQHKTKGSSLVLPNARPD